MATYGYHRISTRDQHLDRGIHEIQIFCKEHDLELENIFTDQQTGKNFNRPRYTVLVEDVLREGDILLVTELDRLGRNKRDTMEQIRKLQSRDVRLMVLELPTTLMDLSKMDNSIERLMMETINNMMLELYASISESEIQKKEKRHLQVCQGKEKRSMPDLCRTALRGLPPRCCFCWICWRFIYPVFWRWRSGLR